MLLKENQLEQYFFIFVRFVKIFLFIGYNFPTYAVNGKVTIDKWLSSPQKIQKAWLTTCLLSFEMLLN